ncbi:MAG: hypothetical protein HKN52_00370 [Eudoraea sp.]|nr:hypothetical protein [Eudoraea sp.]
MTVFRKIKQSLLVKGKYQRYILYAFGEIMLVMVGILLAFQVDKWNDNRLNRIEELKYYSNLKEELLSQRDNIRGQSNSNEELMKQFSYALNIINENDRSSIDTLSSIIPNLFNYSDFDQKGNLYEVLVNSGDIKLLFNTEIVNGIRDLEGRYVYLNRMEAIHWQIIAEHIIPGVSKNYSFVNLQPINPDVLYSNEFQNVHYMLLRIMGEKNTIYQNTLNEIDVLVGKIDKELVSEL